MRQANVWRGIDAAYYSNGKQLEYDLVVAPNADASQIALRFRGASKVTLESDGRLRFHVGAQDIWQQAPVVYQTIDGVRREIAARYVMSGRTVRLRLGAYDHAAAGHRSGDRLLDVLRPARLRDLHPLRSRRRRQRLHHRVSRHQGTEHAAVLARRQHRHLDHEILAGRTDTALLDLFRRHQPRASARTRDRSRRQYLRPRLDVVVRLSGRQRGATGRRGLRSVRVENLRRRIDSPVLDVLRRLRLRVRLGRHRRRHPRASRRHRPDAIERLPRRECRAAGENRRLYRIRVQLNAAGNGVIFSTYFGSPTGLGDGFGVAADPLGNSYVVASTTTTDFPTLNPVQPALNGVRDGWIAKFDPTGVLVYSTYFGGSGDDEFYGVAADALGNAYATGITFSSDYPTTGGAFQPACGGGTMSACGDAVVTKFDPSGAVVYSTFVGGIGDDEAWDVAIDAINRAVIVGNTRSNNFPLAGATQNTLTSFPSPFVTRLSAAGDAIDFSTYHSGGFSGQVYGDEVSVDAAGNIYASGGTTQSDFPMVNALFPTFAGGRDCWIAKWGDVVIITPSPNVLNAQGGANHKMVPVTLSYSEPSSSRGMAEQSVCTVAVSSNEPVNGTGDGDTAPDWVVVDSHHVQLRAERAGNGNGNGRLYTINVTCPSAVGSTTVTVPKKK